MRKIKKTKTSQHGDGEGSQFSADSCAVCKSTGYFDNAATVLCSFCNGTKENTKAAESFMRSHPCQCIFSDRKNCPLCGSICHHSTSNRPKLLVVQPPPR